MSDTAFYVNAFTPRGACRAIGRFENWGDAATARHNREGERNVTYRVTVEVVPDHSLDGIEFNDTNCAVENCGMNSISSVRISDEDWVAICLHHSSLETWPLRIEGRTLTMTSDGDPVWVDEGEAGQ